MTQRKRIFGRIRGQVAGLILFGLICVLLLADVVRVDAQIEGESKVSVNGDSGPIALGSAGTQCISLKTATEIRDNDVDGYLIATRSLPSHQQDVAYLLIVNHAYDGDDEGKFPFSVDAKDGAGHIHQSIHYKNVALTLDYKLEVNCENGAVRKEELTINGVMLDLTKGRFFYVDLSEHIKSVTQVNYLMQPEEMKPAQELGEMAKHFSRLIGVQAKKGTIHKRNISLEERGAIAQEFRTQQ